jgi:two-component system response regulator AtoC
MSTVLLLEDDPSIRELVGAVFADDGHNVRVCGSPSEVLQVGRASPQSLAVVDFWGESQITLTPDDRADIIRLADAVPTILLTARQWATQHAAADLGVLDIVRKPFDVEELSGLVATWIARLSEDSAEVMADTRK